MVIDSLSDCDLLGDFWTNLRRAFTSVLIPGYGLVAAPIHMAKAATEGVEAIQENREEREAAEAIQAEYEHEEKLAEIAAEERFIAQQAQDQKLMQAAILPAGFGMGGDFQKYLPFLAIGAAAYFLLGSKKKKPKGAKK